MKTPTVSHIVSFLDALVSERGASVNTIDAYRRDLSDYEAFLKARGIDALTVDAACVRGFIAARGAQALSVSRRGPELNPSSISVSARLEAMAG